MKNKIKFIFIIFLIVLFSCESEVNKVSQIQNNSDRIQESPSSNKKDGKKIEVKNKYEILKERHDSNAEKIQDFIINKEKYDSTKNKYKAGFIDAISLNLNSVFDIEFFQNRIYIADRVGKSIKVYDKDFKFIKELKKANFHPIKLLKHDSKLLVYSFFNKNILEYNFTINNEESNSSLLVFDSEHKIVKDISLPVPLFQTGAQDISAIGNDVYISRNSPEKSESRILKVNLDEHSYKILEDSLQVSFEKKKDGSLFAINTFEYFKHLGTINGKKSGFSKIPEKQRPFLELDDEIHHAYSEGFDISDTNVYIKDNNNFKKTKTLDKALGISSLTRVADGYLAFSSSLSSLIKLSFDYEYMETIYKFNVTEYIADFNISIKSNNGKIYIVAPRFNCIVVVYDDKHKPTFEINKYNYLEKAFIDEVFARAHFLRRIVFRKRTNDFSDKVLTEKVETEYIVQHAKNAGKYLNCIQSHFLVKEDTSIIYFGDPVKEYLIPERIIEGKFIIENSERLPFFREITYSRLVSYKDNKIKYFLNYDYRPTSY